MDQRKTFEFVGERSGKAFKTRGIMRIFCCLLTRVRVGRPAVEGEDWGASEVRGDSGGGQLRAPFEKHEKARESGLGQSGLGVGG
jgi:hypothetical protein